MDGCSLSLALPANSPARLTISLPLFHNRTPATAKHTHTHTHLLNPWYFLYWPCFLGGWALTVFSVYDCIMFNSEGEVCVRGCYEGEGCNWEASVNLLMKKNNTAVKASQEQVKHSRWGLRSVKAKGQKSTSRPRAGLDLCWAEKSRSWRE